MHFEKLNKWLTLVANLGVIAGIIFLAVEIRQNSGHLALQLEFEATQKIFEINKDLQNPNTAKLFAKAITHPEELTFDEGLVAAAHVINRLNEWEDRYWIYRAGLKGGKDWRIHIQENIQWTLGSRFALEIYKSNRAAFEPEFVEFVDGLLDDLPADGTYSWWTDLQSKLQKP